MRKCESAAKQEKHHINSKIAQHVGYSRQNQRHLDIIVKVDLTERARGISDQHIEQAVEAVNAAIGKVNKKTADQTGQNTLFLALHKGDGDRYDDHQIRGHGSDILQRKHCRLQNAACHDQNKYDNLPDQ